MVEASRIIVAVDTVGSAAEAVAWAAAEAATRGTGLRIVHALGTRAGVDAAGFSPMLDQMYAAQCSAEQILGAAAATAREIASDLEVVTEVLHGPPAWALHQASQSAPLLVLGSRRHSAFRRLTRGSLAGHMAAHAPCPVVIVRKPDRPVRPSSVVVVGIAPGTECLGLLTFAFQAARQRGIALTLVAAAPSNATLEAMSGVPCGEGTTGLRAIQDRTTVSALRYCREQFPGVPLRITGPVGDPTTLLLAEADGAALLVLGSAGSRFRGARDITSVGQRLIVRANCPVAVVGRAHSGTAAAPSRGHTTPVAHPARP